MLVNISPSVRPFVCPVVRPIFKTLCKVDPVVTIEQYRYIEVGAADSVAGSSLKRHPFWRDILIFNFKKNNLQTLIRRRVQQL